MRLTDCLSDWWACCTLTKMTTRSCIGDVSAFILPKARGQMCPRSPEVLEAVYTCIQCCPLVIDSPRSILKPSANGVSGCFHVCSVFIPFKLKSSAFPSSVGFVLWFAAQIPAFVLWSEPQHPVLGTRRSQYDSSRTLMWFHCSEHLGPELLHVLHTLVPHGVFAHCWSESERKLVCLFSHHLIHQSRWL